MRRVGTHGAGAPEAARGARRRVRPVRRAAALAGATLLVASLAACAEDTPARPAAAPPPVLPPPAVVTVAPTTAPVVRAPDVDLAAIRSAPAACGLPVHHLSSYRGSVGTTETTLQVNDGYAMGMDPVPPVRADLTGDGGLDLVGVLSCTVDGMPKPDSLVLYTDTATPLASLDLGTSPRRRYAVVRALRVLGGDVRVEWTAFDDPQGAVTQNEATLGWRGGRLVLLDQRRSSGPRTVTVSDASFLTADGNVHCVLHGDVGWCDVARSTWTPPPSPTSASPTSRAPAATSPAATGRTGSSTASPTRTPGASAAATSSAASTTSPSPVSTLTTASGVTCDGRPYGRTFLLRDGRATRTCAGEQGPEIAALGSPLTTWHRTGWDATVVVNGRRSAALTPGSTMSTSGISCTADASVVTCTDTRTQASFEVGRTVDRLSTG